MSWGAQNRSKDAKTPSVAGGRSKKPELDCCPIQPYGVRVRICTVIPCVLTPILSLLPDAVGSTDLRAAEHLGRSTEQFMTVSVGFIQFDSTTGTLATDHPEALQKVTDAGEILVDTMRDAAELTSTATIRTDILRTTRDGHSVPTTRQHSYRLRRRRSALMLMALFTAVAPCDAASTALAQFESPPFGDMGVTRDGPSIQIDGTLRTTAAHKPRARHQSAAEHTHGPHGWAITHAVTASLAPAPRFPKRGIMLRPS
jgi:hypothetical protein